MVDTITEQISDFTARDFDSWVIELRNKVNAAFPSWTDFNTANFGNILLEMFAHTLDVVSFYQDQQFLETRVVFARLLKSMINLGKNVGFTLPGNSVATATLEITIADESGTRTLSGYMSDDASIGVLTDTWAATASDPTEVGLMILVELPQPELP